MTAMKNNDTQPKKKKKKSEPVGAALSASSGVCKNASVSPAAAAAAAKKRKRTTTTKKQQQQQQIGRDGLTGAGHFPGRRSRHFTATRLNPAGNGGVWTQNKTKKHRMRSKKRKSSHRPIEPSVGRRNPHLCRSQRNKRSKKATRSVAVVRRNEKWTKSAERKRDRERERERGLCEVVRVPRRSVIRNALRRNCADYCALVSLVRSPSRARRSRRVFRFFLSFSSFRWHPLAISWFRSVTELYWVLLGFI